MTRIAVAGEPSLIELQRPPELAEHYALSPYVIATDGGFEMLVRLVNRHPDPAQKISRVYCASGSDGTRFTLGPLAIAPGNPGEPDDGGCEDPTIVRDGAGYAVFYSGYERERDRSQMLRADGPRLTALTKSGRLFADDAYANPKEAAVLATPGGFRVFFECAIDGASRIAVADAPALNGPWRYAASPIGPRDGAFDAWHLSPASAVRRADGTHVLFYNGSTRKTDWRIGWAVLDASATTVIERAEQPLIAPFELHGDDTDIAFAASCVVVAPDRVALYYSISDRRLYRSLVDVPGATSHSAER